MLYCQNITNYTKKHLTSSLVSYSSETFINIFYQVLMHFNTRCHISVNLYVYLCAKKLLHALSFCTAYTFCELFLWIIILFNTRLSSTSRVSASCLCFLALSPAPSLMNQCPFFICFIGRDLLCMVTVRSTT